VRALIADDDRVTATILASSLTKWGFEVTVVHDGEAAWEGIKRLRPPMIVLDWMMPGIDGITLCRHVREDPASAHAYVLLLTSRDGKADRVAGLDSGADDYVIKPFDHEELRARVNVGARVARIQAELSHQVNELQQALAAVQLLEGLIPICSYCKRIRSDENSWEQMESYVSAHSSATFSHGVCPTCLDSM
jgi:sigma-B regulation protein RsbU (phosphoserine phosphatase)